MLDRVIDTLACPTCGQGVRLVGGSVRCDAGHSHDVARHGYVSLLQPGAVAGTADTPAMVAARVELLGTGHFDPVVEAVADAAVAMLADAGPGVVVDAGAGTGRYLARVLERAPGRAGVALDISKHALRRAARSHEAVGAVACDVWRPWPLRDSVAALVLSVFSPRNADEFARVLATGGGVLVVTPAPDHLAEIAGVLGLLDVDPDKAERLAARMGGRFSCTGSRRVAYGVEMDRDEMVAVAAMGPTAYHVPHAELVRRAAGLDDPTTVTVAVDVTCWTPDGDCAC